MEVKKRILSTCRVMVAETQVVLEAIHPVI